MFLLLVLFPVEQPSKPDTLSRYVINGQVVENMTESLLVNKTIQRLDTDTIRTGDHVIVQYKITTVPSATVVDKVFILNGQIVSKDVIDHLDPATIQEVVVDLAGGELAKKMTGNERTGLVMIKTKTSSVGKQIKKRNKF